MLPAQGLVGNPRVKSLNILYAGLTRFELALKPWQGNVLTKLHYNPIKLSWIFKWEREKSMKTLWKNKGLIYLQGSFLANSTCATCRNWTYYLTVFNRSLYRWAKEAYCDLRRTRTFNLLFRRQLLCPVELQGQYLKKITLFLFTLNNLSALSAIKTYFSFSSQTINFK